VISDDQYNRSYINPIGGYSRSLEVISRVYCRRRTSDAGDTCGVGVNTSAIIESPAENDLPGLTSGGKGRPYVARRRVRMQWSPSRYELRLLIEHLKKS